MRLQNLSMPKSNSSVPTLEGLLTRNSSSSVFPNYMPIPTKFLLTPELLWRQVLWWLCNARLHKGGQSHRDRQVLYIHSDKSVGLHLIYLGAAHQKISNCIKRREPDEIASSGSLYYVQRCVRDSDPWPPAWQAGILTNWTNAPENHPCFLASAKVLLFSELTKLFSTFFLKTSIIAKKI